MELNERFPWYGKELHNELPNLPYSEQRRINQIFTEKTKRTAYQKCLVPDGKCGGKVVEGHSVPRSVMRKMTAGAYTISFARQPLGGKGYVLPSKEPINHALTGYFTCEKHEDLFAPIEKEIPDFDNPRHLDLIAYKALLRAMWSKQLLRVAWEYLAKEDPKSDLLAYMVHLHIQMEMGVGYYKHIAEQALGIAVHPSVYDDEPQDCLYHKAIRVPSKQSAVAVCAWSNGLRYEYEPQNPIVMKISQAGCTVYPLGNEHVVVYHYTATDESGVRKANWPLYKASGTLLQQRISHDILRYCEEIVISPEVWQDFSEEKRQAITDYFMATPPYSGLHSPDAPAVTPVDNWHSKRLRLVNLFD